MQGQTPVWAYIFSGKRFDVGDRLGFVEATIEYALRREDLAKGLSSLFEKARSGRAPASISLTSLGSFFKITGPTLQITGSGLYY
jgi:hypothetical protein